MYEKIEDYSHRSFGKLSLRHENLMSGNILCEKHFILLVHVFSSFSSVTSVLLLRLYKVFSEVIWKCLCKLLSCLCGRIESVGIQTVAP